MENKEKTFRAMRAIGGGLCLTMFTFDFAYLNRILPFIGLCLMVSNTFKIRRQNKQFQNAYYCLVIMFTLFIIRLLLDATPYAKIMAIGMMIDFIAELVFLMEFTSGIENCYRDIELEENYPMKNVRKLYLAYLVLLVTSFLFIPLVFFIILIAFILLIRMIYLLFKSIAQLCTAEKFMLPLQSPRLSFSIICPALAILCIVGIWGLGYLDDATMTSYTKLIVAPADTQTTLVNKGLPEHVVAYLGQDDAILLNRVTSFTMQTLTSQQEEQAYKAIQYYGHSEDGRILTLTTIEWEEMPTQRAGYLRSNINSFDTKQEGVIRSYMQICKKQDTLMQMNANTPFTFTLKDGVHPISYLVAEYQSDYQEELAQAIEFVYRSKQEYPYQELKPADIQGQEEVLSHEFLNDAPETRILSFTSTIQKKTGKPITADDRKEMDID